MILPTPFHQRFRWHALLALFLLLCAGCAVRGAPAPAPLPTATPQLFPSPTFTPLPTDTPAPSPTPLPCVQTSGSRETIAAVAPQMRQPLQARVYLPPCYASSPKTRYPVLYLLHGQGFTSDQWERLGMPAAADRMAVAGRPFILVLPNEDDTTANPYDSGFGLALAKSLAPQVDAAYRTCPERACRAIGGLSRGAAWALWIGLQNWGQFAWIGAHSLPPFFGMQRDLPGLLSSIPPGQSPHIYMDTGFADAYRAPAAEVEALLTRSAVPHEWYLNTGQHDEAYWQAHTPDYAAWYALQLSQRPSP